MALEHRPGTPPGEAVLQGVLWAGEIIDHVQRAGGPAAVSWSCPPPERVGDAPLGLGPRLVAEYLHDSPGPYHGRGLVDLARDALCLPPWARLVRSGFEAAPMLAWALAHRRPDVVTLALVLGATPPDPSTDEGVEPWAARQHTVCPTPEQCLLERFAAEGDCLALGWVLRQGADAGDGSCSPRGLPALYSAQTHQQPCNACPREFRTLLVAAQLALPGEAWKDALLYGTTGAAGCWAALFSRPAEEAGEVLDAAQTLPRVPLDPLAFVLLAAQGAVALGLALSACRARQYSLINRHGSELTRVRPVIPGFHATIEQQLVAGVLGVPFLVGAIDRQSAGPGLPPFGRRWAQLDAALVALTVLLSSKEAYCAVQRAPQVWLWGWAHILALSAHAAALAFGAPLLARGALGWGYVVVGSGALLALGVKARTRTRRNLGMQLVSQTRTHMLNVEATVAVLWACVPPRLADLESPLSCVLALLSLFLRLELNASCVKLWRVAQGAH